MDIRGCGRRWRRGIAAEERGSAPVSLGWDRGADRCSWLEAGVVIMSAGKCAARNLLGGDWGWLQEDWGRFRYNSYVVAALPVPLSLTVPCYENLVVGEPAFLDFILALRTAGPDEDRVLLLYVPQALP